MKEQQIFIPEIKFWNNPKEIGDAVTKFLLIQEAQHIPVRSLTISVGNVTTAIILVEDNENTNQ